VDICGHCIDIGDLTGGEVAGAGNFDELMRTVKDHIAQEYACSRITGQSYATVYLGAMQSVLQTANEFTLIAPKATQETKLLEEQVTQNKWQTCLLMKQVEALDADIAIKVYQLCMMQTERLGIEANTCLTVAKTNESVCSLDVMGSTMQVNDAQISKMNIEGQYTVQQCAVAMQQEILLTCQQDNTASQTALVDQKLVTEKAQIDSSVLVNFKAITGCCCSYTGGGVIGAQIALQYKQRDGFDRDAEQKYAKMMQDSFTTQMSVLGDYDKLGTARQHPIDIGDAMKLLRVGAGAGEGVTQPDPAPPTV
jgi:hypothetical protein